MKTTSKNHSPNIQVFPKDFSRWTSSNVLLGDGLLEVIVAPKNIHGSGSKAGSASKVSTKCLHMIKIGVRGKLFIYTSG